MNCIFPQCVNNQVKGEFCIQHGKLFGETVKVLKKPLKRSPIKKSPVKKVKKKSTTIPKLLKKAEKVFNDYIRARDSQDGYFTCISSGQTLPVNMMNAGHYVPVKNSSFLRFHEWNVNGESEYSNCFDEFHLIGYRKNLIEKIGKDAVEYLEANARTKHKWQRAELEEIILKYGKKKGTAEDQRA